MYVSLVGSSAFLYLGLYLCLRFLKQCCLARLLHVPSVRTVKKIFRITDEFAHNYIILVTILWPTLTKMDTLIIQNKLRILRNGFQNSRNPFPILVDFQKSGKDYRYSVINYGDSIIFFLILLFISFHFISDNHAIIHKREAWFRRTTEVSGVGGPGINSLMLLGGTYLQHFASILVLIKVIWFPKI